MLADIPHELEVTYYDPYPDELDLSLFPLLRQVLEERDPGCAVIPHLSFGVTDARFFHTLGVQVYGFTPMPMPSDVKPERLVHSVDERVPVAGLEFLTDCYVKVISRYGEER